MRPPAAERFWTAVAVTERCWPWLRYRRGNYGRMWFEGRLESAHRVAYQLFIGEIPPGLRVLHHCDNPPCCRPDHLFVGTDADNAADRSIKGRSRTTGWVGPRLSERKHSEQLVRRALALSAEGKTDGQIGRSLGIPPATVWKITKRHTWKEL